MTGDDTTGAAGARHISSEYVAVVVLSSAVTTILIGFDPTESKIESDHEPDLTVAPLIKIEESVSSVAVGVILIQLLSCGTLSV